MTRMPRWCACSTKFVEVVDRPVVGMDREEVGDVVAAVAQRRLVHRQQPDAVDAEPLEVVELLDQSAEVAGAVVVAVEEPADVDLVEDRGLEPERVPLEPVAGLRHGCVPGSADLGHVRCAPSQGLSLGHVPGGSAWLDLKTWTGPGRGGRSCGRSSSGSARRRAGRARRTSAAGRARPARSRGPRARRRDRRSRHDESSFTYATRCSCSVSSQRRLSTRCSAGSARRISFSRCTSGSSGPSSFRFFASYFSESRYSSEPSCTGTFSKCSKPE